MNNVNNNKNDILFMFGKAMTMTRLKVLLIIAGVLIVSLTKAQTSSYKNNIYYLADSTTNFDDLIDKFKNKIIYVDIWATWCVPCVRELVEKKDIEQFTSFAMKNDIVVLYITCDNNAK